MKRYVCAILSYILVGVVMVVGLDWLSRINYNTHSIMMQEMYQSGKNIDTVFMGSSHVCYSYDSKLADDMLGVETFNLGSGGQFLITTYYLLNEVEKTNKINTVYLDTFFGMYMEETTADEVHIYDLSDYMPRSRNKIEYLWMAGGIRGLENGIIYRYTRDLRYADIDARLHQKKITDEGYFKLKLPSMEYRGKGFVYSNEKVEQEIDFKKKIVEEGWNLTEDIPISRESYKYLMKIIEYCAKNNINLVLVDQPMPDELLSEVKGYNNYVAFFQKLADQYGIVYMNFNLYKGYDKTIDDFYDSHHLNGPGAEKYTRIFCNTVNALKKQEKSIDDFFYQTYIPNRVE